MDPCWLRPWLNRRRLAHPLTTTTTTTPTTTTVVVSPRPRCTLPIYMQLQCDPTLPRSQSSRLESKARCRCSPSCSAWPPCSWAAKFKLAIESNNHPLVCPLSYSLALCAAVCGPNPNSLPIRSLKSNAQKFVAVNCFFLCDKRSIPSIFSSPVSCLLFGKHSLSGLALFRHLHEPTTSPTRHTDCSSDTTGTLSPYTH